MNNTVKWKYFYLKYERIEGAFKTQKDTNQHSTYWHVHTLENPRIAYLQQKQIQSCNTSLSVWKTCKQWQKQIKKNLREEYTQHFILLKQFIQDLRSL